MQALPSTTTTQELMQMDYKYNYGLNELHEDWMRLRRTVDFKAGAQFKPGMKLCQHFCDNFWQIENDRGMSFEKAWQDPVIMDRVLNWGKQGMSQLWLSWIRRAVFMVAGLPNSSFYRPHFSRQVIQMTGKPHGVLFDPCAGWGGRMLGAASADWDYYACEPNFDTWHNLQRMLAFIQPTSHVYIYNQPVETLGISSVGPVDVVLTSPPYFNLEVYNHTPEQSYNTHNTYDAWRDNWLVPLIGECLVNLKTDGISAWNVMNFRNHDLVQDVIDTHTQRGWVLVDTLGFQSPLSNIRKLKNRDVTYLFRHQDYLADPSKFDPNSLFVYNDNSTARKATNGKRKST